MKEFNFETKVFMEHYKNKIKNYYKRALERHDGDVDSAVWETRDEIKERAEELLEVFDTEWFNELQDYNKGFLKEILNDIIYSCIDFYGVAELLSKEGFKDESI